MDYRRLDCGNRPTLDQFMDDWGRTAFHAVRPLDPRLTAMARALSKTHVNGGAQVAQFEVVATEAVAWVLTRNRLDKFAFMERFFEAPSVAAEFPRLGQTNERIGEFAASSAENSATNLAALLRNGGAYRGFKGTQDDVVKLANQFMSAVCEARFPETTAWTNDSAWAQWFRNVAWDASYFWFDTRRGIATILLITDTD